MLSFLYQFLFLQQQILQSHTSSWLSAREKHHWAKAITLISTLQMENWGRFKVKKCFIHFFLSLQPDISLVSFSKRWFHKLKRRVWLAQGSCADLKSPFIEQIYIISPQSRFKWAARPGFYSYDFTINISSWPEKFLSETPHCFLQAMEWKHLWTSLL